MENGKIDRIIDKYHGAADFLIHILLEIQNENQWLPREALERISSRLKIPFNQVLNIATFHKGFSLVPEGRQVIQVCNGISCHVRGSQALMDEVRNVTGIKSGETDHDLNVSYKTVTCLGCCSSGPAMMVDGEIHGDMDPAKIEGLLKK